jgi:hypothetical protein
MQHELLNTKKKKINILSLFTVTFSKENITIQNDEIEFFFSENMWEIMIVMRKI